jgi:hypothetical protein
LSNRYPRLSTDRKVADEHNLEWVTPGHPLFEALRRAALEEARPAFADGACFYSVQHDSPARLDFYRARVVDGLGNVMHERLFAVEQAESGDPILREPSILCDLQPATAPNHLPAVATMPESSVFLQERAFRPFLEEVRTEREAEVERIRHHVEIALTELIARADQEIGRFEDEKNRGVEGSPGLLAIAEEKHEKLCRRRGQRLEELERQKALSLQGIERVASTLIVPHPEREQPEIRRLRPNPETEQTAMRVAMKYERAQGRAVADVHEKNLGYDLTSLDTRTGELRLIEVKGLAASEGDIILTPNEHRVAEDRRECYWLYVVTACATVDPELTMVKDPASHRWLSITKVEHYTIGLRELRGDKTRGGN